MALPQILILPDCSCLVSIDGCEYYEQPDIETARNEVEGFRHRVWREDANPARGNEIHIAVRDGELVVVE